MTLFKSFNNLSNFSCLIFSLRDSDNRSLNNINDWPCLYFLNIYNFYYICFFILNNNYLMFKIINCLFIMVYNKSVSIDKVTFLSLGNFNQIEINFWERLFGFGNNSLNIVIHLNQVLNFVCCDLFCSCLSCFDNSLCGGINLYNRLIN